MKEKFDGHKANLFSGMKQLIHLKVVKNQVDTKRKKRKKHLLKDR